MAGNSWCVCWVAHPVPLSLMSSSPQKFLCVLSSLCRLFMEVEWINNTQLISLLHHDRCLKSLSGHHESSFFFLVPHGTILVSQMLQFLTAERGVHGSQLHRVKTLTHCRSPLLHYTHGATGCGHELHISYSNFPSFPSIAWSGPYLGSLQGTFL
jgi:hypothetical protein